MADVSSPARSSTVSVSRENYSFLAAWVLALLLGAWSLGGVQYSNPVDTDAARHAMNGAFLHDLVRDGGWSHPMAYAKRYYSHMPALSLPFHPPLFPAVEAAFFFVFGVNLFAARLAVALAVVLSALLLYRLVRGTGHPSAVALASMFTVVTWGWSERVARDVMLEFPALVFALAALYCLRNLDESYSLRQGAAFALLAGAAVWTKQQTVFVGAVPFGCILLTGSWTRLREKTIWISSAAFGALVVFLAALSLPFGGAGIDQASKPAAAGSIFIRNLRYYASVVPDDFGPVQCALLALAIVLIVLRSRWRMPISSALYVCWSTAAFVVLLLIKPYSSRYLFFLFPAIVVLGYSAIHQVASLLMPPRVVWAVPAVCAVLAIIWGIHIPAPFLRGPEQAAQIVTAASARRILYCGGTDGAFIFDVRSREDNGAAVVLAGEKLAPAVFSAPEAFSSFAHNYGVEYVVLERASRGGATPAWDSLIDSPPPDLVPVRDVPLGSSDRRWNGRLRVFRFTNPSAHPENKLGAGVNLIGRKMDLTF